MNKITSSNDTAVLAQPATDIAEKREQRASAALLNLNRQISPTIEAMENRFCERGKFQRAEDYLRIAWDAIAAARCAIREDAELEHKERANITRRTSEIAI